MNDEVEDVTLNEDEADEVILISSLRYLNVDAREGYYQLMPGINIVVGDSHKEHWLTDELRENAGLIEFSHLQNSNHIVVGRMSPSWFGKVASPDAILFAWINFVDWLIKDSWLIKDNSIVCEVAYSRFSFQGRVVWSNNGLFSLLTKASGEQASDVTFDESELDAWNTTSCQVRDMVFSTKGIMGMQVSDKSYTKFARFYHFVDTSRRTRYPAVKIAHCCSALESLFSTDTTELSHKLAERIAFLLAGYGENAEDVYKFIRDCYSVRSAVTHGSAVSGRLSNSLESLSARMLDVLRKIVLILMEDAELFEKMNGKNEGVEQYFRELIFSHAKRAETDPF